MRVVFVGHCRITDFKARPEGVPQAIGHVLVLVVRADGSLAVGERQRKRLEAEGVPFNGARVDLRAAWFAIKH